MGHIGASLLQLSYQPATPATVARGQAITGMRPSERNFAPPTPDPQALALEGLH